MFYKRNGWKTIQSFNHRRLHNQIILCSSRLSNVSFEVLNSYNYSIYLLKLHYSHIQFKFNYVAFLLVSAVCPSERHCLY